MDPTQILWFPRGFSGCVFITSPFVGLIYYKSFPLRIYDFELRGPVVLQMLFTQEMQFEKALTIWDKLFISTRLEMKIVW